MKFALISCVALSIASAGAWAQEVSSIQTPSGNIHCSFTEDMGGAVICEILEINGSLPQKPDDCDLDYGSRYTMDATGDVSLPCYGDTIRNSEAQVVAYGEKFSVYGITCYSKETGLSCTNQDGHGFLLSRAKQSIY